jgi:hypothetical protein
LRCRPRSPAPGGAAGGCGRLDVCGAATAASSVSPSSALETNAGCPQPRIEDEAAARAERGLHVGCFQRRRFYQESKRRWRDLPSGARLALAFADFGRVRRPAGAPAEVPLQRTDPVMREWVLA